MVTFSHADTGTSEAGMGRIRGCRPPRTAARHSRTRGHGPSWCWPRTRTTKRSAPAASWPDCTRPARRSRLVLCTAGEASHPDSQTTTPEQLAAVRLTEFDTAVSGLAPSATWRFLELPDGQLAANADRIRSTSSGDRSAGNSPRTWSSWPPTGPTATRTTTPSARSPRTSRHRNGYGLLEYPIWYWLWAGTGDDHLEWLGTRAPEPEGTTSQGQSDAMPTPRKRNRCQGNRATRRCFPGRSWSTSSGHGKRSPGTPPRPATTAPRTQSGSSTRSTAGKRTLGATPPAGTSAASGH